MIDQDNIKATIIDIIKPRYEVIRNGVEKSYPGSAVVLGENGKTYSFMNTAINAVDSSLTIGQEGFIVWKTFKGSKLPYFILDLDAW